MKITYKGDYALKAVLDLALHYGNLVTIQDMARRLDIPLKFLEQILLDLKRAGFVESRRGKIGGYLLAKPPAKIKLKEVLSFMEGQIEPIACIAKNYDGCNDMSTCVFRDIWRQIAEATSHILNNITFEDLVKKSKVLNSTLVYQI